MEKEFKLSDKIYIELNGNYNILLIKDVKEFIKRRNILDRKLHKNLITWAKYLDERRELSGDLG